jgi:hypothetical protein
MTQLLAFAGGETFFLGSRFMFGTLDFLAIGELNLAALDVLVTVGARPARSTRSKAEKRCLKRRATTLKWCLNRHVRSKATGAPTSTLVGVIGHQSTYVLYLLEDDSSRGLTGANSDAEEVLKSACFVAPPPLNENGRGDKEALNQEEYQRQAHILAREASLRQ